MNLKPDLDSWVARISYKPGWELRAKFIWDDLNRGMDLIEITVGYRGPDSTPGHHDLIRGVHHSFLLQACGVDREVFTRCVLMLFQELELHELREWFRVDGKHYVGFEPHDPKNDWHAVYRGY